MRKTLIVLFLFGAFSVSAQQYAIFKASVVFTDGTKQVGVLYDVRENEVVLTKDTLNLKETLRAGKAPNLNTIDLKQGNIHHITLRRKGFVFRSLFGTMVYCGISGTAIGYFGSNTGRSNADVALSTLLGGLVGTIYSIVTVPLVALIPKRLLKAEQIKAGLADDSLRKFSLMYQQEQKKEGE